MKDLTNKRFGKLIAIAPTDRRAAHGVIWKCLCDCGNFGFIRTQSLLNGHTKSCGCLNSIDRLYDYTDKVINSWKIIRMLTERDKHGHVYCLAL